jgi:hypothetical protein
VQNIGEDGVENGGGQHKDNTYDERDILGIAIADPATHPSVGETGHAGAEEKGVEQVHKLYSTLKSQFLGD